MEHRFLEGSIRHRRFTPIEHGFTYPIGMYALVLERWAELDGLSRWVSTRRFNWCWFRRGDYFAPEKPDLDGAVRDHVEQATGWLPDGPVVLITHPRYLGYCFNPVSFYACYRAEDAEAENPIPAVILTQITNTPWGERHTYVLEAEGGHAGKQGWWTQRYQFTKDFHVSPFNPMDMGYDWLFSFRSGEMRVHMNVNREGKKVFDATLAVQQSPLTRTVMSRSLRRYPIETLKGTAGIYWNAFKLKWKGARFHDHPGAAVERKTVQEQPENPAQTGPDNRPKEQHGRVTSWKL